MEDLLTEEAAGKVLTSTSRSMEEGTAIQALESR